MCNRKMYDFEKIFEPVGTGRDFYDPYFNLEATEKQIKRYEAMITELIELQEDGADELRAQIAEVDNEIEELIQEIWRENNE